MFMALCALLLSLIDSHNVKAELHLLIRGIRMIYTFMCTRNLSLYSNGDIFKCLTVLMFSIFVSICFCIYAVR